MRTVLTIGREPDNDLVINLPIVSGHHARVTWQGVPGRALIEDLGSSNGTAIGQMDRRITQATVTASDVVYFGNHPISGSELLSWVDPSLAPSLLLHGLEMVVGREPGCHRVIERPTISGRHARLKRSGERITVEDLGSSNGTYVNGQRIDEPTEVKFGDLIGFGVDTFRLATGSPTPVAGTQRIEAIRPAILPTATPTIRVDLEPIAPADQPSSGADTDRTHPIALAALLLQAPVLAGLIGLISGNVATTCFLLSLAAVWFGLSAGVFGLLLDPKRPHGWPQAGDSGFWSSRLAILATLGVVACLLAEVVAFPIVGLKAPAASALGLMILASAVGLAIGLLIVLLAPNPPVAWAGLAAALVVLGLFGGGPGVLPRTVPVVRMASNAAPSRWAFEGLLVSESDQRPTAGPAEGSGPARDLAEDYFPSQSDRMGVNADAMALGSMLAGLLGVGVFLVKFSGDGR